MFNEYPRVLTPLRQRLIRLPDAIKTASGIDILGQYIQGLMFTTDVAIIRNNNADAIMAVYPFTPQPVLTQAIATVADKPVLMGVGGGTTQGKRVVNLALHAEFQGALAVVLNAPVSDNVIKLVDKTIDIPIVSTVVNSHVYTRLESGADILNVAAGPATPRIVAEIRAQFPEVPIIATGGPTDESIRQTILAGANAITFTPPSTADIFTSLMENYRGGE